jgi:hypothetical protein
MRPECTAMLNLHGNPFLLRASAAGPFRMPGVRQRAPPLRGFATAYPIVSGLVNVRAQAAPNWNLLKESSMRRFKCNFLLCATIAAATLVPVGVCYSQTDAAFTLVGVDTITGTANANVYLGQPWDEGETVGPVVINGIGQMTAQAAATIHRVSIFPDPPAEGEAVSASQAIYEVHTVTKTASVNSTNLIGLSAKACDYAELAIAGAGNSTQAGNYTWRIDSATLPPGTPVTVIGSVNISWGVDVLNEQHNYQANINSTGINLQLVRQGNDVIISGTKRTQGGQGMGGGQVQFNYVYPALGGTHTEDYALPTTIGGTVSINATSSICGAVSAHGPGPGPFGTQQCDLVLSDGVITWDWAAVVP